MQRTENDSTTVGTRHESTLWETHWGLLYWFELMSTFIAAHWNWKEWQRIFFIFFMRNTILVRCRPFQITVNLCGTVIIWPAFRLSNRNWCLSQPCIRYRIYSPKATGTVEKQRGTEKKNLSTSIIITRHDSKIRFYLQNLADNSIGQTNAFNITRCSVVHWARSITQARDDDDDSSLCSVR